jgi:hypothetical protein
VFSGHGGPRHEVAHAVCGVTVGELGERFGQPGVRVDAGDLAVFDERGDHGPVVAAFVGAGEQGIFAIEGQRSDAALDGVGVEVDAAVVDKARQAVPAGERIADRFAEPGR